MVASDITIEKHLGSAFFEFCDLGITEASGSIAADRLHWTRQMVVLL